VSVDSYKPTNVIRALHMLRGVSGNALKKFPKVCKILRENDRSSVDPSLSGNGAQAVLVGVGRCHAKFVPAAKFVPGTSTTDYVRVVRCRAGFKKHLRSCCQRRNNIIQITDR
jgi:hypothetical protein